MLFSLSGRGYNLAWRPESAGPHAGVRRWRKVVKLMAEAYLDIETTGLSPYLDDITVIGIYLVTDGAPKFVQLVGEDVTRENLLEALEGTDTIFTYNGRRFDLPFIKDHLDLDLEDEFRHHDLMYDCWRKNLYGGFKSVEQQLGIPRRLTGMGGFQAVILWWKYRSEGDRTALELLLEYNREDVVNLRVLREILEERGNPESLY